jgi:hypothetical protein
MLVNINPELYGPAVVLENRKKVLYVEVLKAMYSTPSIPKLLQVHGARIPSLVEKRLVLVDCGTKAT